MTARNIQNRMVRVPDDVVFRELDGALVVTSLSAGGFLRLDDIGREIWTALADGLDLEGAVGRLIGLYDVPRDECRADVLAFVEDLVHRGFVSLDEAPR